MLDFGKVIGSITKQLPFSLGKPSAPPKSESSTGSQPPAQGEKPSSPDAGQIEIGIVQESSFDTSQIEDLKKQVALASERVAEMEARVAKAEKSADAAKKENEQLKGRMDQTDSRILDMLSVYEVVSNQINPFVGSSKVLSSTIEQLQEELNTLKSQVSTMGADLKILSRGKVDISRLVRTSVSEADEKRRVDLTKLIRSAVQSKKTVRVKKGNELEFGP